MDKSKLTSKSPLRVLEESVKGGLDKGKVTVIASKKGVGKTACLVHIAIEKLLEGKQVLHAVVGEGAESEHLQAYQLHHQLVRGSFQRAGSSQEG